MSIPGLDLKMWWEKRHRCCYSSSSHPLPLLDEEAEDGGVAEKEIKSRLQHQPQGMQMRAPRRGRQEETSLSSTDSEERAGEDENHKKCATGNRFMAGLTFSAPALNWPQKFGTQGQVSRTHIRHALHSSETRSFRGSHPYSTGRQQSKRSNQVPGFMDPAGCNETTCRVDKPLMCRIVVQNIVSKSKPLRVLVS